MPEDNGTPAPDSNNLREALQLPQPRIWRPRQLADFLSVSLSWIYKRTQDDAEEPIPHLWDSARLRFDTWSPAFLQWMQRQLITPPLEDSNEKPAKDSKPTPDPPRKLYHPSRRRTFQRGNLQEKPRNSKNWTLRYRELNHFTGTWTTRRKTLGYFKSKAEALGAAAPVMVEVNEHNNADPDKPEHLVTFRDFIEFFWKPYAVKKKFEVTTIDHRISFLTQHLLPYFGKILMREIRPSDISKFMLLKATAEPHYSNSTLRGFYQLLRMLFDLAEQNDVVDKSPVRPKLHKPETVKVEKPVLTVVQIRDVLAHLDDPQERLFMLLLAVTGMRIGEGLALRWMDFNAPACQLSINHTLYRGKLKAPKTQSSKASLILMPQMVELLLAHQRTSSFAEAGHYIFSRAKGKPLEGSSLRHHLYEAMDKVGIKRVKRKYGAHIFRHSAGTLLYEKSRDLKLVQGTLRHSDVSTTSNIYVHLGDQVLGEGSQILTTEIIGPDNQNKQSLNTSETSAALNAGQQAQRPAALIAAETIDEPPALIAGQAETEVAAFNAGEPEQEPAALNAGEPIDETTESQEGVESPCQHRS